MAWHGIHPCRKRGCTTNPIILVLILVSSCDQPAETQIIILPVSSAVISFATEPYIAVHRTDASGALHGSMDSRRHDRLAADEALQGADVSEEALDGEQNADLLGRILAVSDEENHVPLISHRERASPSSTSQVASRSSVSRNTQRGAPNITP